MSINGNRIIMLMVVMNLLGMAFPVIAADVTPTSPPVKAEVGEHWIQNAKARVEIEMKPAIRWWTLRYLLWNPTEGKWEQWYKGNLGAKCTSTEIITRLREQYGASYLFQHITPTQVTTALDGGSAMLSFRLRHDDWWAEYRVTLLADTPYVYLEQTGMSGPEIIGSSHFYLPQPQHYALSDSSTDTTKRMDHAGKDHREGTWTLSFQQVYLAYRLDQPQVFGICIPQVTPQLRRMQITAGLASVLPPLPCVLYGMTVADDRSAEHLNLLAREHLAAITAILNK